MVSPFLYFAGERLSLAELTAACLDGLLTPIGEGYMPADAVETTWMRARSLAPLIDDRLAAVRLSAAWVHGGVDVEPARHRVQRASARRARPVRGARVVYHDVRLDAADVVTIAGVHVARPERALVDLARSEDAADHDAARTWARTTPGLVDGALGWLARHPRFPYGRRAEEVLATATTT